AKLVVYSDGKTTAVLQIIRLICEDSVRIASRTLPFSLTVFVFRKTNCSRQCCRLSLSNRSNVSKSYAAAAACCMAMEPLAAQYRSLPSAVQLGEHMARLSLQSEIVGRKNYARP